MWWPNQDYFGLVSNREPTPFEDSYSCRGPLAFLKLLRTKDFSRVCSALEDPQIRAGIIDIWLNRDYSAYAAGTGHTDLTPSTWQPSDEMRMYIRKDVVQQMWSTAFPVGTAGFGSGSVPGKIITLSANPIIDASVSVADECAAAALKRRMAHSVADCAMPAFCTSTWAKLIEQWARRRE
jgi:hypothetical protein